MSDTLANLRRKIDGAGKLKSVVRTMKAVAASSIGQYESAVRSLADYEHSVELGLGVCFRKGSSIKPTSKRGVRDGAIGAVVFGSDQGLVGQFNEAIAEFVEKKLTPLPGTKKIWTIGERISGRLADVGLAIERQFAVPTSVGGITSLVGQLQIALENASKSGCNEIHVFHAQPTVGALYEPVAKKLIPLDETWQRKLSKAHWPTNNLAELFGDTTTTLQAYIREYLFIVLFKACAESLAAENASRLAAMQRAEKNINSLLTNLNRNFYRLRQNSIDEELFDVVAGFNALS